MAKRKGRKRSSKSGGQGQRKAKARGKGEGGGAAATATGDIQDIADDVEFQLPEFDETEFILKEVRDARLGVVTIVFALAVAIVTRGVEAGLGTGLAFLFGLAAGYGLKVLFEFLGTDLGELDKKSWLGLGAIYFFAWLGFWTLLLNGPFA